MTIETGVAECSKQSLYENILPFNNAIQKIYVELTEHCNLECRSCFRNNWDHSPIHMSDDVLDKLIADAVQVETFVIGGIGEPSAHPKFCEFSKLLKHKNLELTTNAYLWGEEVLDALASCYKKVTVSVDGLPDSFSNIRGFDFEILAENVRKLVRKKSECQSKLPVIHAQATLSTENKDEIKALIPILKKIGFQRLVISNILPQSEHDKDKISYTPYLDEELRTFVYTWYPAAAANQLQIKIPFTKLDSEHRCAFIENGAVCITANGDVSPCYRFMHEGQEYVFGRRKTIKPVYFGNIMNAELTDIWNQDDYVAFRFQNFASRYPSCVDCDYVELCEYINSSEADCRANEPSCADCLWCRGLIECP